MADYSTLPQHDQEEVGHAYPQPKGEFLRKHKKTTIVLATAAIALLATSAFFLGASNELSHNKVHYEEVGISAGHFMNGLNKCKAINRENKHEYPLPEARQANPRFVNGTAPTLFKNGYIFDGVNESYKGDVLIDRGLIVAVGGEIKVPKDAVVVDLKGHILTPGIVDMHR